MSINELVRQNYSGNVPAAVAGVPGQADLFTITVPTRARLKFKSFGNYTDTIAAWGFMWWSFINNGNVMPPYERIMDQLGYGPQRQPIQELEVFGGSTFVIRGFNNTAGIIQMGVSFEYELIQQD